MVGIIDRFRDRRMKTPQRVRHVEAGTKGRLLRVCMDIARMEPEWFAVGPIEQIQKNGKTTFRQRLER